MTANGPKSRLLNASMSRCVASPGVGGHWGPSMHDDWRRERFSARSTLPPYFAAKAALEGIPVARKSA